MFKATKLHPFSPRAPRAQPLRARSASVRVRGARLHYLVTGEGPPLVLVHGYSAASSWWRHNVEALAAQHTVYALDLIGFGRSRPKRTFSLRHGMEHIVAWMDSMALQSADFCGHSMGGHVCMHLAAAYPERVRRLVLVDASGIPFETRLGPLAWRGFRSSGHTRFRFAPTVVRTSLQAGPLVLWSALRDLLADDVRAQLERIVAPTLIIWGERDVLVPLELGRALHAAIPGAQLVVVRGAGHNVMVERPDEFNRLVLDYLCQDRARDLQ